MHTTAASMASPRVARVPAWRSLAWLLVVLGVLAALSDTAIGVSSSSVTPNLVLDSSISLTDPTAINASPAPTNSPTWTSGAPDVLNLGDLAGSEVASASLTWLVSTNDPDGYSVQLSNPGAAPVMQPGGASGIDDMGTTPAALNTGTTAFGVAVGDAVSHNQASANFAGTPWGTTGGAGTQGTLYRGVPTAGMQIAGSTSAQTNHPVTINFAAVSSSSDLPTSGAYTGAVRVTATTL